GLAPAVVMADAVHDDHRVARRDGPGHALGNGERPVVADGPHSWKPGEIDPAGRAGVAGCGQRNLWGAIGLEPVAGTDRQMSVVRPRRRRLRANPLATRVYVQGMRRSVE